MINIKKYIIAVLDLSLHDISSYIEIWVNG